MKKISIAAILALAISANASGFTGGNAPASQGGFLGGHSGANSVKAALDARDDTLVTVKGKILSQVAHEKYKFSDGKDTIIIEIDDEDWGGLSVGPDETITIYGEVDGNTIRANEIDVKRITK
ncbi:NirD/YgiW/YdeI family stress tolerance protein [Campylobacter sp.]|uniref:NirD/YgiW/YdeI family stress tolerance protein n=1 Tax=Campylobacter sp. TaxID=205 RepID=UPI001B074A70|nr:NirD/YgiW/YdeI family stress tolerance protein [Campylobacter sp.]MBO5064348.1 NirD/YgiW/YdeI family stress tolerance protein [Campylobacter sp.]MBQ7136218.1 NirD/YgiW/YdeI family stress tolerance protein [Campylobacter sp.]MBQ8820824.1 NirD/YgiW/YdeI family stress tolerance protein [Campylobacter sp.]